MEPEVEPVVMGNLPLLPMFHNYSSERTVKPQANGVALSIPHVE